MVAPLSEIQKQLSKLNTDVVKLRQELVRAYQNYLLVLNDSVQKQLILVCFGLCTERHADKFLSLTLTQRQTLQQDLQKIGHELGQALTQQGRHSLPEIPEEEENPVTLYQAVGQLEMELSNLLRTHSLAVNRILEQHNILKIKSLDALFEIVAKAEQAGRPITNPPFLIKAIIDPTEETEHESLTQPLTAVYLQLADLEFADAKLLDRRQPIRQLMQKLNTLQKSYCQMLEDAKIAEASAAWRASWYSYNPEN